jgi:tight adherence protein C
MIGASMLQIVLAGAVGLLLIAVLLVPMLRSNERIEARIRLIAAEAAARGVAVDDEDQRANRNFGSRLLLRLGRGVVSSGLLSQRSIDDLENSMGTTGERRGTALPVFIGAKVALLFGTPVGMWLLLTVMGFEFRSRLLPMVVAAIVGMLAPDYIIRSRRKKYLKKLELGLPDALDLLIICAEAGLALEAGFDRVAAEFGEGNAPAAQELKLTASEMKILADRRRALLNMGTRTGIEAMTRLGGTLAQTIQYGTPISQALRVLAAEMRQTTLTRFEEKASRLPVMLTIPMILFILPCIFLVVGGPAAVSVLDQMSHK